MVYPLGPPAEGPPLPPTAKTSKETIIASVPPPGPPSKPLIPPGFNWSQTMQHSLEALYRSTPGFLKPGAYILVLLQTLIAWVSQTRGKSVDKDVLTNQVKELASVVFTQYPEWKESAKGQLFQRKIKDLSDLIQKREILTREEAEKILRTAAEELKAEFGSAEKYAALQSALETLRPILKKSIEELDINLPGWTTERCEREINFAKRGLITLLKKQNFTGAEIKKLERDNPFTVWHERVQISLPTQEEFLKQYTQIERHLRKVAAEVFQTPDIEELITIDRVVETTFTRIPFFQIEEIEAKKEFVESIKIPLREHLSQYAIDVDKIFTLTDVEYASLLPALGAKRDLLLERIESEIAKREEQGVDPQFLQKEKEFLSGFLSDYRLTEDMAVFLKRTLVSFDKLLQEYRPGDPLSATDKQKMQEALAGEAKKSIDDYIEKNKHCLPKELQEQLPLLVDYIQAKRKVAKQTEETTGKPPELNILSPSPDERAKALSIAPFLNGYSNDSIEAGNLFFAARVISDILTKYDIFYSQPTLTKKAFLEMTANVRDTVQREKQDYHLVEPGFQIPVAQVSEIIANLEPQRPPGTTSIK